MSLSRWPRRGFRIAKISLALGILCGSSPCLSQESKSKVEDVLDSGLGDLTYESQGVDLVALVTLSDFPSLPAAALDVETYESALGQRYAMVSLSNGAAWVNVEDTLNPRVIAEIPGAISGFRDAKSYGEFAYVSEWVGGTLQVIDLTALDQGLAQLTRLVTDGGAWSTLNLSVDTQNGFLYRAGASGIRFYDLTDPSDPVLVGEWLGRFVADLKVVEWLDGREIAFCASGDGGGFVDPALEIIDVSDKLNPLSMARIPYPNAVHAHHVTLDIPRALAYLVDDFDEDGAVPSTAHLFDLSSDLTTPQWLGSFQDGSLGVSYQLEGFDHFTAMASMRSGLRVFDVRFPDDPFPVGHFDTVLEDDDPILSGLSGVSYVPGLDVILGADSLSGLFIWDLNVSPLEFRFPLGIPERIDPRGGTKWRFSILDQGEVLEEGTEQLWLDVGSGFAPQPLVSLGNRLYEFTFPSVDCGRVVRFYVEALVESGGVVQYPVSGPSLPLSAVASFGDLTRWDDDFETNRGWTVGSTSDDATAGLWARMDPESTSAQPEDDHTELGNQCWVTDGRGGSLGQYDVDGGSTSLTSPNINLGRAIDPILSFWVWYDNSRGQEPNSDLLEVLISDDAGVTWVPIHTVGPGGPQAEGGWYRHEISLSGLVSLTRFIRIRFVASDLGGGSIVEAAVDDIRINDVSCPTGVDESTSGSMHRQIPR